MSTMFLLKKHLEGSIEEQVRKQDIKMLDLHNKLFAEKVLMCLDNGERKIIM